MIERPFAVELHFHQYRDRAYVRGTVRAVSGGRYTVLSAIEIPARPVDDPQDPEELLSVALARFSYAVYHS